MAPPRVKSQTVSPSKSFKNKPKGGKGKSLSRRAISEISDAARFAEKIGSDKTFSDLAKQYKQFNVKYDRPATFRETYGEEVNKVGTPLASTYYKDPVTGEERFFTAQAPTFGQLMGDIGRGLFSGYNTLSYDPNAGGIPTTTGGQIVRRQGLFPLLADKAMSGEFGLMGIAKGLYDKFTNSAAKAKDALVEGVNKLSDIDLEVLKNKDQYKFLSKKSEIQEVEDLQKTQMTEFDKANLIRANMERVSTPITEADTAQSFKVQPEDQVSLQDIYMQGTKRYEPISVSGAQPMYAGGLDSLLPQSVQNLQQRVSSLGETPIGTFGLENIRSGKPAFTYEKDIFGGQLGLKADPFRDQYGLEFSRSFNEGGSVDNKLDDMQKKTNNIYGTGILSAR
jgi:hypothetical protein